MRLSTTFRLINRLSFSHTFFRKRYNILGKKIIIINVFYFVRHSVASHGLWTSRLTFSEAHTTDPHFFI